MDPAVALVRVGPDVNAKLLLLPSTMTSTKVTLDKVMPPVLLTVIVYTMVSPCPVYPSPLSVTVAVFVASIFGSAVAKTSVKSLTVFPSLSLPLSLISITSSVFPGLLAVTSTLFRILPVAAASA